MSYANDTSNTESMFKYYKNIFEKYLAESMVVRNKNIPEQLSKAMEYSLVAGGKRLRPVLCLASAVSNNCSIDKALPMAMGLEMLHTATLIHDDLPCMDNDDLRRGKPTNHKIFGETMAILAGDALLAQAIEYPLLHLKNIPDRNILAAMKYFSVAIGPSGVCGGQVLDMFAKPQNPEDYVKDVAKLKTGALIRASVLTGVALTTTDSSLLDAYADYSEHLGCAFQIVDDILDVTATAVELGKTPGKDEEQKKITHVTVFGLEKAKKMAERESVLAQNALLNILPPSDFLIQLPSYLVNRTK